VVKKFSNLLRFAIVEADVIEEISGNKKAIGKEP